MLKTCTPIVPATLIPLAALHPACRRCMYCADQHDLCVASEVPLAVCVQCNLMGYTESETTRCLHSLWDESDEANRKEKAAGVEAEVERRHRMKQMRQVMTEARKSNEAEVRGAMVTEDSQVEKEAERETEAAEARLRPNGLRLLHTLTEVMIECPGFLVRYTGSQPTCGLYKFEIVLREFWLLGHRHSVYDSTISGMELAGIEATCARLSALGGFACTAEAPTSAAFFSRQTYCR